MTWTGNFLAGSIAKQRLNIILLVDASSSMRGTRISQVNESILEIKDYLSKMEEENTNVDFYITLITYSTQAFFYNYQKCVPVKEFNFQGIQAGGWSNLHLAYKSLSEILKKESQGGIMPDFGGVAPIILLMSDGHPSKGNIKTELSALEKLPWFRVALKYGISIESKDEKTIRCLSDFVSNNGDVIECYDSRLLKRIIKIIVITASKVKSTSSSVRGRNTNSQTDEIRNLVQESIAEVDDWEW